MVCFLTGLSWALQFLDILLGRMDKVLEDLVQKWKIDDTKDLNVVKFDDIEQLSLRSFWLVGRLITSKPYSVLSLRNKMKQIWRIRDEVAISEWFGSDRLLFSFSNDSDRKRVLRGGPWKFDNAMLIMACYDGSADPTSFQLDVQNFWIRVRGLPPKLLSKAMGRRIGNMMGTFVGFDPDCTGDCSGNFLRIRVSLDIYTPLRRWIMLETDKDVISRSS